MSEKITYVSIKPMGKPNIIPKNGIVALCCYCGEQIGNTQKYCSICKTKKGREGILEENLQILTELREKGYCKEQVLLPAP